MILLLKRILFGDTYIIGELSIDGVFQCFTLEDQYRQIEGKGVAFWKVAKRTAIPTGSYPVIVTFSNRFQKYLPLLLGVEGFDGVRIHTGNTIEDTEGCILVGNRWDGDGSVAESVKAFQPLFLKIKEVLDHGEKVNLIVQ